MRRRILTLVAGAALLPLALVPALADPLDATAPGAVSSTGASPLSTCTADTARIQSGEVFPSSEVEPWVATNPQDPLHLVGAWQQDRWSNGGARGLVTAVSFDGGVTWTAPNTLTFSSLCTGGTVANGGDLQRATDPWVTFTPNGDVYLMSLSLDDPGESADHAMLVMKSVDGGLTWGEPTTLIRENDPNVLNDKNSITADPNEADGSHVYAVWDRLVFPTEAARGASAENAVGFEGPTLFTRTTNGGATWETPRVIFTQRGKITQTIGNQIVVLPDNATFNGELINGFNLINIRKAGLVFGPFQVAVIRSVDQGETWSGAIIVDKMLTIGVTDPFDEDIDIRTGDVIPEFAVDPVSGTLYAVWQDARFSGFAHDSIAFSMSEDGGLTWTPTVRINQTPDVGPVGNRQAFTPSVHVLSDGTIGVTYYDFRNNGVDASLADPLETDYFIVHCHPDVADCTDRANWAETQITDDPFDMRQAPFARGFFVGDYEGLTHTDAVGPSFLAFFGQAFAPDPATIFASRVEPLAP